VCHTHALVMSHALTLIRRTAWPRAYLPPGRALGLWLLTRRMVRHMARLIRLMLMVLVLMVAGLLLGDELVVEGLQVLQRSPLRGVVVHLLRLHEPVVGAQGPAVRLVLRLGRPSCSRRSRRGGGGRGRRGGHAVASPGWPKTRKSEDRKRALEGRGSRHGRNGRGGELGASRWGPGEAGGRSQSGARWRPARQSSHLCKIKV
jgi:hypothetical protein